jgi:murein L,D-transpeptidase YcbB/YkuD
MTYVEFNPGWTIPPTILREDTLPAIRKNPDYLASRNILVFDHNNHEIDPATIDWNNIGKNFPYSLRQEPGPENALGLVKFIFPNPYFVYMHDTPHRELFDRPQRSYSSGCIRVEDPFRLVELVLKERQNFTPAELEEILRSGRTQRVLLEEPLPVMILYLTAAVDVSGVAQFYQDIYDRDPAVLSLLDGPVSAVDR